MVGPDHDGTRCSGNSRWTEDPAKVIGQKGRTSTFDTEVKCFSFTAPVKDVGHRTDGRTSGAGRVRRKITLLSPGVLRTQETFGHSFFMSFTETQTEEIKDI